MNPGHFYMHKNALDVCIQIERSTTTSEGLIVEGTWWNLGYVGHPWSLGDNVVFICKNPLEWHDITKHMHKHRLQPGLPQ